MGIRDRSQRHWDLFPKDEAMEEISEGRRGGTGVEGQKLGTGTRPHLGAGRSNRMSGQEGEGQPGA